MNRSFFKILIMYSLLFTANCIVSIDEPIEQITFAPKPSYFQQIKDFIQEKKAALTKTVRLSANPELSKNDNLNTNSSETRSNFNHVDSLFKQPYESKASRFEQFKQNIHDRWKKFTKPPVKSVNTQTPDYSNELFGIPETSSSQEGQDPASIHVFAQDTKSGLFTNTEASNVTPFDIDDPNQPQRPLTGVRRRGISEETIRDRFAEALPNVTPFDIDDPNQPQKPLTGVRRRGISEENIRDRFSEVLPEEALKQKALNEDILKYEKDKQDSNKKQQALKILNRIQTNLNDPNVSIEVLQSLVKQDLPEDIKNDIRTQLRLRGQGRMHDFSLTGLQHALKSDKEVILDFLKDDEHGINDTRFKDQKVQNLIQSFSPKQRVELFNAILDTKIKHDKNFNQINKRNISPEESKQETINLFNSSSKQLQSLMPDNNILVVDSSGKSPKIINIDVNGWNPEQTVKANIERIKIEQKINLSSKTIETIIQKETQNKPGLFKYQFESSEKVEKSIQENAAQDLSLRLLVKNIKPALRTFLSDQNIDQSETEELKRALSKFSGKDRAQLLTEITQETTDLDRSKTKSVFTENLEKFSKILPDTDLLMITHNQEGKLGSYKFTIVDMSKFVYDKNQSFEENTQRLIKEQKLTINRDSLVTNVEQYYQHHPL